MYHTDFGRALRALADDRAVATAQGCAPRFCSRQLSRWRRGWPGSPAPWSRRSCRLRRISGDPVLATSFLIVILGGLGSVGGATVAAFIVGMVEAFSSVYLGGSKGALALFVLVLIMLVVRPSGLFGHRVRGA